MTDRRPARESLADYFRCPVEFVPLACPPHAPNGPGYFRFGADSVCYGTSSQQIPAAEPSLTLPDLHAAVERHADTLHLPFDPSEIADNLRRELYVPEWRTGASGLIAKLYYLLRPLLPVAVRKHLQKFHLRDWQQIAFPRWPLDSSVDDLFRRLLLLCLQNGPQQRIPFIWFWPEGMSACTLMTHDVETAAGRDFCLKLADTDARFGIRGSYQVVPEERYSVSPEFRRSLQERGCEVAVHDLNHDGHLYKSRSQFLERARKINAYLELWQVEGFRAGILYRKQLWYDALKCAFDMSVPNVAHLDPQRGGCCTVMPYFIGEILEIPVTMTQDYTLFNILDDYSIDLWKQQIDMACARNGLMSFIVHPDYVMEPRAMAAYEQLLGHLQHLARERNLWMATPGEVNTWWRQRAAMRLVNHNGSWHIEGPGSERAVLAWATAVEGSLAFTFHNSAPGHPMPSRPIPVTQNA